MIVAASGEESSSDGSVTHFFDKMRVGDADAVAALWNVFLPRLSGLARKTLLGRTPRSTDADDAIQSAFISFWQQAKDGGFTGDWNRNDLWNLLATITVRKAINHSRHDKALKRGGGLVIGESSVPAAAGSSFNLDEALSVIPTQEFDLYTEELLSQLDDELRQFAFFRLMGHSNQEIASLLDCTERKVERKMQRIRAIWSNEVSV